MSTVIPIKGLFEAHIIVRDLQRSVAFYRDVLGLSNSPSGRRLFSGSVAVANLCWGYSR